MKNFKLFGSLVWEYIRKDFEAFLDDEISEYILPLAEESGLCQRAAYDPEIHGDGIDAEAGDGIWFCSKDEQ